MKDLDYPQIRHLIGKDWLATAAAGDRAVINPANGAEIGRIPQATAEDLSVQCAAPNRPLRRGRIARPPIVAQSCAGSPIFCGRTMR